MNVTRIAILGVAATAAGAAALLVRSMLGGESAPVQASLPPPTVQTTDVLVASTTVPPGTKLEVGAVRWDAWPNTSVADSFITKQEQAELSKAVEGLVVRAPLFAGQPITNLNTVRSDVTGFMAATLMPGMRAVATAITAESGAGGFLLPNDRVDVLLTYDITGGQASTQKIWRSSTVLRDVRLLAIDQNAEPPAGSGAETQSRVGKTATLELSPSQAEILQRAVATGTVSLTLRSLGDSTGRALANMPALGDGNLGSSTIVRYGVVRDAKEIAGR
jgi:pilus assembly protein CpaB